MEVYAPFLSMPVAVAGAWVCYCTVDEGLLADLVLSLLFATGLFFASDTLARAAGL